MLSSRNAMLQSAWYEGEGGKKRVFQLRVKRLAVGDALLCPLTGWRVVAYLPLSKVPHYKIVYRDTQTQQLIEHPNQFSALNEVYQFLIDHDAPLTLMYVRNGGLR